MPLETIKFNNKDYPLIQTQGFASQYAFPFAKKICTGFGVDIGYSKPEWKLPGAIGIDLGKWMPNDDKELTDDVTADKFNIDPLDYVFSSHCLEHLNDWVGVLDYWGSKLKQGGVMFLYLPNADYQEYWRPFYNRKHVNWFIPDMLEDYLLVRGYKDVFVSKGYDMNGSFYVVGSKP